MSDTDPLRPIRQKLDQHEGKPLSVTLAAEEVEALREALELARRYPRIQAAWLHACSRLNQVRDVRLEFQRDHGARADQRALTAVRELGRTGS